MKIAPILFNSDMVCALLDGRKTQTRRIVKPQPFIDAQGNFVWGNRNFGQDFSGPHIKKLIEWNHGGGRVGFCPYGQPGDLLWVRETWAQVGSCDPGYLTYRATYPDCLPPGLENVPADIHDAGERWRPSIHMPRWASRITLRLTDVRVQRLQEISEPDVVAEGITKRPHKGHFAYHYDGGAPHGHATHTGAWRMLWDSINAKRGLGWDVNPWVWALLFEVIRANVDQVLKEAA